MRLIDAKTIEKQARMALAESNPVLMGQILRYIRKQPTIDAVEVVRCKDCKHLRFDEDYVTGRFCALRNVNGGKFCEDNDFCSYGERRNGNA